jgi:hypothetical protein
MSGTPHVRVLARRALERGDAQPNALERITWQIATPAQ